MAHLGWGAGGGSWLTVVSHRSAGIWLRQQAMSRFKAILRIERSPRQGQI